LSGRGSSKEEDWLSLGQIARRTEEGKRAGSAVTRARASERRPSNQYMLRERARERERTRENESKREGEREGEREREREGGRARESEREREREREKKRERERESEERARKVKIVKGREGRRRRLCVQ
jgi:hypothetical protein